LAPDILAQLHRESMYVAYEDRQRHQIAVLQKDEHWKIPSDLDFQSIPGLSFELRHKLDRTRPETLAQAARIEGMTPAALALIHLRLRSTEGDQKQGSRV